MFWDRVAWIYDVFTNIINRKTHKALINSIERMISDNDDVLECACGTGLLSGTIAKHCKQLVATDLSLKMLKRAKKKYKNIANIEFRQGNIMQIEYPSESFDIVVAANVIHLLDNPVKALQELNRVCKKNGKIIVPTYINQTAKGKTNKLSNLIGKAGADFKKEFTFESYKEFFKNIGYNNVEYTLCEGKIPCAVAVIHKL